MMLWLRDRSIKKLWPGSPEFFAVQKALILNRPLVKRCYEGWYARLQERESFRTHVMVPFNELEGRLSF